MVHQFLQYSYKARLFVYNILEQYPEVGAIGGAVPFFIEVRSALGVLGLGVSVAIGVVTLLIKIRELREKRK